MLVEIGPRFCLNPIKVFEGSLGGKALWSNKKFLTPVQVSGNNIRCEKK